MKYVPLLLGLVSAALLVGLGLWQFQTLDLGDWIILTALLYFALYVARRGLRLLRRWHR